jgi:predicted PurR-regulated permease PerM
MADSQKFKIMFASALVGVLTVFLVFALWPYVNALFGALILFVLFKPLHSRLQRHGMRQSWAAGVVIILSLVIIMVPLFITASLLIGEVTQLIGKQDVILERLSMVQELIPQLDLMGIIQEQFSEVGEFIKDLLISATQRVANIVVGLTIAYFTLYYLLINSKTLSKRFITIIPFNRRNANMLQQEFRDVTYSVVISTGTIAVLQGALLGLAFYIFGLPGALLWGFVAAVLSFLPVVGPSLVWGPASLLMLLTQNYVAGIGILVFGLVLSNVDNFLRPLIQRQVGRMHPLVSLIGIFIGIPIFGILGLIIGPLMLSYFFLTLKMFREEYLST